MDEVLDTIVKFKVAKDYVVDNNHVFSIERTHVPIPKMKLSFSINDEGQRTLDKDVSLVNTVLKHDVHVGTEYEALYNNVCDILNKANLSVRQLMYSYLLNYASRGWVQRNHFPGLDVFCARFFNPTDGKEYVNVLNYTLQEFVERKYVPLPPYYFYKRQCGLNCSRNVDVFVKKHKEWYKFDVLDAHQTFSITVNVQNVDGTTKTKTVDVVSHVALENKEVNIENKRTTEFSDGDVNLFLDACCMVVDIMTLPPPETDHQRREFCAVLNNMLAFDWLYAVEVVDGRKYVVQELDKALSSIAPPHVVELFYDTLDDCTGGFSGDISSEFSLFSNLNRYRRVQTLGQEYPPGTIFPEYEGVGTDPDTLQAQWNAIARSSEERVLRYYSGLADEVKNTRV